MSIGPIVPLVPLQVNQIPERREEWPIFDVEQTAQTDDEYYASGQGQSGKGADDNPEEFEQQLSAAQAEDEEQRKAADSIQDGESPTRTVNFFA